MSGASTAPAASRLAIVSGSGDLPDVSLTRIPPQLGTLGDPPTAAGFPSAIR